MTRLAIGALLAILVSGFAAADVGEGFAAGKGDTLRMDEPLAVGIREFSAYL